MRVATILLRFGTDEYVHAESDIDELFRRQMPEVERTTIIVDNALPASHFEQVGGRTLIGGDNAASEFSGFDRAVQFLGSSIWRYDFIHFATSAFRMLYVDYVERFSTAVLEKARQWPVCLGHIDCYDRPVEILSFSTRHWIRTCFFFMPPSEVKALGGFATVRDGRLFFSGVPEAPFRVEAPLSPTYRDYIVDWLTGQDIGQGVKWHSSFALTRETLPTFERKALAIMNEQLLGARLRAMGCRLVDVTWLASALMRTAGDSVPWDTSWQEQLSWRGRSDAAVAERVAEEPEGLLRH
jgi:hypothetical protein